MNSFGSDGANRGVGVPEIKLQMLEPNGFNHNNINGALDELESSAYYLYYAQMGGAGKRYWFHTKPNLNILINQAKSEIKDQDVVAEILKRLSERTRNTQLYNTLVAPTSDIPEQLKPTLIILSPIFLANPNQVNGNTKPVIEKLATKKGNGERIYRNTILFLVCSEIGIGKLNSDIREYLACLKINLEYHSQLERDQRDEIKKRLDDASKLSESSIVNAYSIVVKYSVKNGAEKLLVKQFKDSIDSQINNTLITLLKEAEWLLDSVGLNTLRNNNLLPAIGQSVKVKDIYEAFLRFDDKPMITGSEAVSRSLLRYCMNGEFCIATGDGNGFTRFYLKESVPYFDVTDNTYWLADKSLKPIPEPIPKTVGTEDSGSGSGQVVYPEVHTPQSSLNEPEPIKKIKAITVSGKVPLERYTELFNYFITPFAMSGNKIDIEVSFRIISNAGNPIDESKQQYKNVKEAAKQLKLDFNEEI